LTVVYWAGAMLHAGENATEGDPDMTTGASLINTIDFSKFST